MPLSSHVSCFAGACNMLITHALVDFLSLLLQSMPRGRFFRLLGLAIAAYFLWPLASRSPAVRRLAEQLTNSFRLPRPAGGGKWVLLWQSSATTRKIEIASAGPLYCSSFGRQYLQLHEVKQNVQSARAFAALRTIHRKCFDDLHRAF